MSEIRNVIQDSIADRASSFSDAVTNLDTGEIFNAEIEEVSDIELNSELGRDPRESVLLHLSNRAAADSIKHGTKLQIVGARFAVTRRKDNPFSVQVEFGCRKLVNRKDS